MPNYDFTAIEKKWQDYWEKNGTFRQPNPGEKDFQGKPKFYILDMFPYPSGEGLHVGHPEGYTATDIVCRYRRMKGFNVLHPMGYDAFGLPAEQYAVEHGVHPRETTAKNIANIERQIKMFGFSYDWSRRVATTDTDYYRWTQWIFLQLYNSWYDPEAQAARPISELESRLNNGQLAVDVNGNLKPVAGWQKIPDISLMTPVPGQFKFSDLEPDQRRRLIDEYRLAYMAEVPVNWCPKLGTVLANEEVTNEGRSDRGDHPVYRRAMKQWMLRITAFADRLEKDLELLDWPEPIKIMQRNWIGKSSGAEVDFPIEKNIEDDWFEERKEYGFPAQEDKDFIRVYTTRPDTLFGATYMVLAPEHPLVNRITTPEKREEVKAYVAAAVNKTELERTADAKEKTGVFTGAYALNPVNQALVPIWVADYVMMGYGTGAIMAVPAHDTRDFEFAKRFGLPIIAVVMPPDEWLEQYEIVEVLPSDPAADTGNIEKRVVRQDYLKNPDKFAAYVGDGVAVNSADYDGMPTAEFKKKITDELVEAGLGRFMVNYKLRDWLFSRQRYWGEPFPIVHCERCGTVALAEDQLPVLLPEMEDFRPETSEDPDAPPRPPLGKAKEWASTTCPSCGGAATRELNTMPQWAGSCWYYLRYLDPKNAKAFCGRKVEKYWMGENGVDLYVGGAEHAVLHLLYARFWHKVLFDLGHVSTSEPFHKLFNQGMIRSFAYRDGRGVYVGYDDVDLSGDRPRHRKTGETLSESVEKMSKSLKNVINPDEVVSQYGADTFRLYEMFMGPLEASKPWNTRDVPGVHRFLGRVWRLIVGDEDNKPLLDGGEDCADLERPLHRVIKKVGEDVEAMKSNTAIAAMMEFVNAVFKAGRIAPSQAERFVLVLAPFAPHIAEELWQKLGRDRSLSHEPWPAYDAAMIVEDVIEIPIQVNGKLRAKVSVPAAATQEEILAAAMADAKIAAALEGKTVVKKIIVPKKLVNFVVK